VSSLSESGDTIPLAVSDFLPEPREMDNTKWTGHAGADQWDAGFAHRNAFDVESDITIERRIV
jgi:hypothetical protein